MKFSQIFLSLSLLFAAVICTGQHTGFALSTDHTAIFYRTFGAGKPLLIINGGPGMNSDGFENLGRILGENFQSIIYDQRGTGKSVLQVTDSSTIRMKLMIDDIEAIRKQLHIEKWSVLGHSFGGMVASYYATQYPERIEKIVLSSSGGIDLGLLSYVQEQINARLSKSDLDSVMYWTRKISEGDTSHFAKLQRGLHLAPAYVINKKFIPVIAERLTQGNTTINQLIWADLNRIHFDCANDLKSYNKPVLIIQGGQDIIRKETAENAHRVLSKSKLVLMDHCVHYGWLDNPEVYFKEVITFLKS